MFFRTSSFRTSLRTAAPLALATTLLLGGTAAAHAAAPAEPPPFPPPAGVPVSKDGTTPTTSEPGKPEPAKPDKPHTIVDDFWQAIGTGVGDMIHGATDIWNGVFGIKKPTTEEPDSPTTPKS
ncbi:hypothetical protein [Streptomyces sp. NPDC059009]|uniref:hypothetical protein n=1 Tax=Streptomyces sp. NPDC059009 TaxID=3346694 RepID=UPI0036B53522